MGLGILGAAISLNLTYFINLGILDMWISMSGQFTQTRIPYDFRALQAWKEYLGIGIYGALLECLGWWNLNICMMFSGYLGVSYVGA